MNNSGPAAPFLHVANGTCTTHLIQAARIPGRVSIWADPLYEGPVPAGLTDAELIEVRTRYLAGSHDQENVDPINDLRQWRAAIERHESYDELILWFEHDLFDQLNLIQLLSWIRERLPIVKRVSLVCIGAFSNHPRFKGLGELTPDELASLLETREPLGESHYSLAARAWQAFRQPTPVPLANLHYADTKALPYLAAAIDRFLQEYPWTLDGLSRTERRLLQLAVGGEIELALAFPRMHEDEQAYYVTDRSLASLADALSRTTPPLLALRERSGRGVLEGSITLTDTGRAVLAAERDKLTSCGIDRWLGGVHLQGRTVPWRWDDSRQTITLPDVTGEGGL